MTIRNLDDLLHPPSVAVVGAASERGVAILRNLHAGGFAGPVRAVDAAAVEVDGTPTVRSIADLDARPGLAVLAGPIAEAPARIAELGAVGWRMALVVSPDDRRDPALGQAMLDAARPHLLRIIGPGSFGIVAPPARLDASLSPVAVTEGGIALLSESASIASALLDWAAGHAIGFSAVLTLGGRVDVGLSDCLDLLAGDPRTRAILDYMESIPDPRRFLSAARATARLKPVIALKAGGSPQAAAAAETHTGRHPARRCSSRSTPARAASGGSARRSRRRRRAPRGRAPAGCPPAAAPPRSPRRCPRAGRCGSRPPRPPGPSRRP